MRCNTWRVCKDQNISKVPFASGGGTVCDDGSPSTTPFASSVVCE